MGTPALETCSEQAKYFLFFSLQNIHAHESFLEVKLMKPESFGRLPTCWFKFAVIDRFYAAPPL